MRKLLKQAVCFGLTAAMTLGMCSSAFATGAVSAGGSVGVGGDGLSSGGGGSGSGSGDRDNAFRVYIAKFGDLITGERFNYSLQGLTSQVMDAKAVQANAIYVAPPGVSTFLMWDSTIGQMVAIPSTRITNVDGLRPNVNINPDPYNPGWAWQMVDAAPIPGDIYSVALNTTYGDQAKHLESIMAGIMAESKKEGGGEGSQAVIVDAITARVETLKYSDMVKELEHYINWWEEAFNGLLDNGVSWPADCATIQSMRDSIAVLKSKAEGRSSGGGPSTGGSASPILTDDEVKDFYAKLLTYPCIVFEPIALTKLHPSKSGVGSAYTNHSVYYGITQKHYWEYATRNGSGLGSDLKQGPFQYFGHGCGFSQVPTSGGKAQKHWRSTGWMAQSQVINTGDLTGDPETNINRSKSGVLFYGCFGELVLFSGDPGDPRDPEDPPPENPPPPPPNDPEVDGDLADFLLMDYEINHVFDSIAEKLRKGNGSHTWMKLGTDQHTVSGEVKQQVDCAGDHGPWDDYDTTLYYEVDYQENTASGPSISIDDSGTKLFLKNNGKYGDTWFYRDEIKSGQTLDSRNVADYTVDYAFNLLRRHFKDDNGKADNRVYSLLVEQKVTKDYLDNVLGMYEGMIPKDVAVVEEVRDSMARLRAIQDSMSWTSKFNKTGRQVAYETEVKTHTGTYYCGDDDCSGHSCSASWNALKDGPALQGYIVGGSGYAEYSWDIISLAHKYRTKDISTGFITPKLDAFDRRETADQNGGDTTPDDETFRDSVITTTKVELEYYPEVPMLGDEVPGPDLTHEYKPIITIGEEKRKTRTPMLLLYRLESASPDVTGTVYTDTAVGGSSYLGTNKVALTAGGDFTVKADTKMTINLYGYALDIIESSDPSYAEVTRSNDVKAAWGEGRMASNRSNLLQEYTQWAGVMLNPNSYQADFEMLSGGKKYNSFSATVGGFTTRASNSKEEGSYPLVFRHGDIVKTEQGYKDFIKQLAQDYACSEAEADALFEASEMKQAVIKSIEHDGSSENKSQAQTVGRDQVQLGNSSHWYDEEVRTIVMRRFMTPQGTFKDIIAQDKMDIGNAMEGNTIQNGQFRLTLWFNDDVYTKADKDTIIYQPSTGSSDNRSEALSRGNIILCGLHVSGADFQLTRSTTATGKH